MVNVGFSLNNSQGVSHQTEAPNAEPTTAPQEEGLDGSEDSTYLSDFLEHWINMENWNEEYVKGLDLGWICRPPPCAPSFPFIRLTLRCRTWKQKERYMVRHVVANVLEDQIYPQLKRPGYIITSFPPNSNGSSLDHLWVLDDRYENTDLVWLGFKETGCEKK